MHNIISKILLIIVVVLIVLFAYKMIKAPSSTATVSVSTVKQQQLNGITEKEQIQLTIKEYLMDNPEIIIQAVEKLQKRKMQEMQDKINQYIKDNKSEIENTLTSPVFGNMEGDIVIVAFYDYNCSYCRKGDFYISQLIKADPNVKVILRPFPILGDASNYAAKVALAVYKTEPNKFEVIHNGLMQMDPITKASVEQLLLSNNLNVEIIEQQIDKEEINNLINKNIELTQNLKIQGVPAYIINSRLVPGLMDLVQLQNMIKDIRSQNKDK